jgi:alcohol dehydrogenase, propanol-preferring
MSLGEEAFVALEGSISKNKEVLIYPWIGERLCPACMNGEENLCDKPRSWGTYAEGGYAEYVLVPSYRYLVKMGAEDDDHDLNTDSIATLSCSVTCSLRGSKECQSDNVVILGN